MSDYRETLRASLEREAFAIEGEQRKLQQLMLRTRDPLERRGIHIRLQGLALEHQKRIDSINALDRT